MPKQVNLDVKQLRSIHIYREPVAVNEQGEKEWRFRLAGEYELTDDTDRVLYSRQIEIIPDSALLTRIEHLYAKLLDAAQDQEGVKPKVAKAMAAAPKSKRRK